MAVAILFAVTTLLLGIHDNDRDEVEINAAVVIMSEIEPA